jgi:hypothetical protein
MGILQDLDNGNKTILRCRDTLARLLGEFDLNGAKGTATATLSAWVGGMADRSSTAHADLGVGVGPTPGPFALSPSSAWAWQLLEPGLFGSAHDPGGAQPLQFSGGFEMPPG